jgi:thiol-disulfide isomerase/thioredoxin
MRKLPSFTLLFSLVMSATVLHAASPENAITNGLKNLRTVPTAQRPAATLKLATDIRALPAGQNKLKFADELSHLATEGDPGKDVLQAVTDTLSQALTETPIPSKTGQPPMPYMDVAKLVRYEHVTTDLKDPLFDKAAEILAANDAELAKADFTLTDLHNKKVTLSQLRGKIVLVNFWATWCPPCQAEMADLDVIQEHFESQGLVILSITNEEPFKVGSYFSTYKYHPTVLIDTSGKVAKQFHVDGIPRTFVFDRDGKVVAQSIDMRTQRQFLNMLGDAGLHP